MGKLTDTIHKIQALASQIKGRFTEETYTHGAARQIHDLANHLLHQAQDEIIKRAVDPAEIIIVYDEADDYFLMVNGKCVGSTWYQDESSSGSDQMRLLQDVFERIGMEHVEFVANLDCLYEIENNMDYDFSKIGMEPIPDDVPFEGYPSVLNWLYVHRNDWFRLQLKPYEKPEQGETQSETTAVDSINLDGFRF